MESVIYRKILKNIENPVIGVIGCFPKHPLDVFQGLLAGIMVRRWPDSCIFVQFLADEVANGITAKAAIFWPPLPH